ncbi:MAG: radical SAM protein [Chloroflexales bacterium]|nr:radical SAM protein [Chloroflexales bacterium]
MMNNPKPFECRGSCFPQTADLTAKVAEHPCYSKDAHFKFGRIHVPVAPRCNIQCNYCTRKFACPNENRPGVTTKVISPDEAINTIGQAIAREPRLKILGVAGPGDALDNSATLETFAKAQEIFPFLTRCLSTNGLLLPDMIDEIDRVGITTLTITINAVDPDVGEKIYSHVRYKGATYRGRKAFEILNRNQLEGLRQAAMRGMVIKVNSVMIPGINDQHLVEVARVVKALGAYILNVIPMIPLAKFAHITPPSDEEVNRVRDECAAVIQQFRNCMRCRADAIGIPGEEGCGSEPGTTCSPKFLQEKPLVRLQPKGDPA